MRILLYVCFVLHGIASFSQDDSFQSFLLSDTLTENADAIIRLENTTILLNSKNDMEVQQRYVVTVLRKSGVNAVPTYAFYDPDIKLKNLEVLVYDKLGKEIDKIKSKDFKDVAAVSGGTLYGDSRLKYYDYTPISYPYTIDFSYSYTTSNTAFVPSWRPITDYRVSIENSTYSLVNLAGIAIRKLEQNLDDATITNKSDARNLNYSISNRSAVLREMLAPSLNVAQPSVLVGLNEFELEGVQGTANDWASFGKWQYDNLVKGQDELPLSTINAIKGLIGGETDPLEKAKIIYKYVQDNTRYISVQLGIGGWMPISASEVDRVKYGDCKGLTNYTKALLKSQGIDAYYSVVYAGASKRSLQKDIASMQGNHVILNLPLNDKDIWLECTSQTIPFGFLGDFTDDRDVLVITPNGGELKHTTIYANEENLKTTTASIKVLEDGGLQADLKIESKGIEYDENSAITHLEEDKRDVKYKERWDNINGLKINSVALDNNKSDVVFTEELSLEAPNYTTTAGNDILVTINAFDNNDFVPKRYRNRIQDFSVSRGYSHVSNYTIEVPNGYKISFLPDDVEEETDYGVYAVKFTSENNTVNYKRKLLIKKGVYAKEQYNAYRTFRRSVAKHDNLKLILTK